MPLLVLEEGDGRPRARRAAMDDYAEALEALLLLLRPGEVTTYGDVAKVLGVSPRLVGRLLARNPRPIVVPCHRVVARNGLGGYGLGGPAVKARLLELESDGPLRMRSLASELLVADEAGPRERPHYAVERLPPLLPPRVRDLDHGPGDPPLPHLLPILGGPVRRVEPLLG